MPRKGGLEVLASVREQKLDLAVIMTTAVDAVDVAIEALRLGADDYLRKPFDSASFQQVLERRGVAYEMQIYRGAGHGFTGETWRDAALRTLAFLKKYLGYTAGS